MLHRQVRDFVSVSEAYVKEGHDPIVAQSATCTVLGYGPPTPDEYQRVAEEMRPKRGRPRRTDFTPIEDFAIRARDLQQRGTSLEQAIREVAKHWGWMPDRSKLDDALAKYADAGALKKRRERRIKQGLRIPLLYRIRP